MDKIQYCVVLREGENAGKKQYFSAPKDKMQKIFDGCRFTNNGKAILDMSYITGIGKDKVLDKVHINKKSLGSLEIKAKNEESANKIIKYFGLESF